MTIVSKTWVRGALLGGAGLLGLVILPAFFCWVIRSPSRVCYEGHLQTLEPLQEDVVLARRLAFLPLVATDISYVIYPYRSTVRIDFSISKKDFLYWASKNGWALSRISGPAFVEDTSGRGLVRVDNGFQHVFGKGNSLQNAVLFNIDSSMCYYRTVD